MITEMTAESSYSKIFIKIFVFLPFLVLTNIYGCIYCHIPYWMACIRVLAPPGRGEGYGNRPAVIPEYLALASPVLAIAKIWGVDRWMEDVRFSVSLLF